jgi:hypothetical protein
MLPPRLINNTENTKVTIGWHPISLRRSITWPNVYRHSSVTGNGVAHRLLLPP